jgi:S1-C subfamily serine protease
MSLSGIGSRAQLGTSATYGVSKHDADSRTRARTSSGDDGNGLSIGLLAAGGVGLVGGLALRFAGLGKVGTGIAAIGGALLGASLLSACGGPKGPPVPGDEGEPGGSVMMFPDSLKDLAARGSDTTNPAPADYDATSGGRDAREGVVLLSHGGGTGSGWVIEPGTVVTNYHVAQGHRELSVTDHTGNEHDGVVRKLDRQHDLAIVDVPTLKDTPLGLDDTIEDAETGETTGYPHGEFSNDRAVAVGRVRIDDDGRERQALYFSGSSAEGVSGGAVINGAGEVMGTSFAVGDLLATDDDPAAPFVLAIPNEQVEAFLRAPTPPLPAAR